MRTKSVRAISSAPQVCTESPSWPPPLPPPPLPAPVNDEEAGLPPTKTSDRGNRDEKEKRGARHREGGREGPRGEQGVKTGVGAVPLLHECGDPPVKVDCADGVHGGHRVPRSSVAQDVERHGKPDLGRLREVGLYRGVPQPKYVRVHHSRLHGVWLGLKVPLHPAQLSERLLLLPPLRREQPHRDELEVNESLAVHGYAATGVRAVEVVTGKDAPLILRCNGVKKGNDVERVDSGGGAAAAADALLDQAPARTMGQR